MSSAEAQRMRTAISLTAVPIAVVMAVEALLNSDNVGAWIYLACAITWVTIALTAPLAAWRTSHPPQHHTQQIMRLRAELDILEMEAGR